MNNNCFIWITSLLILSLIVNVTISQRAQPNVRNKRSAHQFLSSSEINAESFETESINSNIDSDPIYNSDPVLKANLVETNKMYNQGDTQSISKLLDERDKQRVEIRKLYPSFFSNGFSNSFEYSDKNNDVSYDYTKDIQSIRQFPTSKEIDENYANKDTEIIKKLSFPKTKEIRKNLWNNSVSRNVNLTANEGKNTTSDPELTITKIDPYFICATEEDNTENFNSTETIFEISMNETNDTDFNEFTNETDIDNSTTEQLLLT